MRVIKNLIFLMFTISSSVLAEVYKVTIALTLTGFNNTNGKVSIAIWDSEATFLNKKSVPVHSESLVINQPDING